MKRLIENFRFGREIRAFRRRVRSVLGRQPEIREAAIKFGLSDTALDYIERTAGPLPTRDNWEPLEFQRRRLRSEILGVMNGAA